MRKGITRNMQHALWVDQIDPTKGFVHGESEDVIIPNAGNLGLSECEEELRRLAGELAKANNELAAAKRERNQELVELLGQRISSLCARRSPLKRRVIDIRQSDQSQILGDAIRSIAPPDMQSAIFEEAKRLQQERWG
jgi:hypothetical protein